ncbi:hypothetical protein CFN58_27815, partial [Pseudomonas avellanae]
MAQDVCAALAEEATGTGRSSGATRSRCTFTRRLRARLALVGVGRQRVAFAVEAQGDLLLG